MTNARMASLSSLVRSDQVVGDDLIEDGCAINEIIITGAVADVDPFLVLCVPLEGAVVKGIEFNTIDVVGAFRSFDDVVIGEAEVEVHAVAEEYGYVDAFAAADLVVACTTAQNVPGLRRR